MGILDHLTCLLRNLYAGQEAIGRTRHGTTGSTLGKEYIKAVYCHPAYLTYMQNTSCEMLGWIKHISDVQMTPTLMAESEEELKSPLMEVKEESEKDGLKLNTQKTKIMASGSITSWQIDGEAMETVTDFIFLGSKITADGDCSQKLKDAYCLEGKL